MYYSGDKIKKNEMGGECGTLRSQESCVQCLGGEICGKEATWKDLGIDGTIILKLIFEEMGPRCMDWFDLAHDRYGWGAVVNAVMNFRVS